MNMVFFSNWRRALVWPALLSASFMCRFEARANPTGGTVTQGAATFSSSGSTFNINQTSGNAWINWSTFNVNQGETVNFNQPSASSITWNQINDVNPSQILGNINANGYIVLQNANGFYIGGQAAITAHGVVMTTGGTSVMNLSTGGPWSFDAPPPTAKIENYGTINITGGGTAYLIAADIVNGGTISAPNGQIGLYDGETVLVSTRPNGEGLSAQVTLPQGSVDNEGKLTAAGGSVIAQAQFVNQNGIIQADTAENVNGTIELLGSSVTLGANSSISAAGDSTATGPSAGGLVDIQGSSFSDVFGSSINVSGASQGGNAGQVYISAAQMSALNSAINGQAAAGYLNGTLSISTADITLNSDGSPAASGLALDIAALSSGLSQVNLQASDDITLNANTPWTLAVNGGVPSSVLLQAGNAIEIGNGSRIEADGGSITLKAPTIDIAGTLQADSVGSVNAVIEIDASLDLILEDTSKILATGDPNDNTSASPGGFVVLNAANGYSDVSGSAISVSGNSAGGQGGIVELFDPGAGSIPVNATVSGAFAYLVNPYDMTLSGNTTVTSPTPLSDPNFNVSDLAAYSQMDLQALDDIDVTTAWSLNNPVTAGSVSLTAGNSINVGSTTTTGGISAGQNWNLNLTAGTAYSGPTAPASGSDGIYLYGADSIQSLNGNINLWAANEVQVGWMGQASAVGTANSGAGSITTGGGGNINVTTLYGDVNTGSGTAGFAYINTAPYYTIFSLGGISTAAGGNVNITAGGNVTSYTPSASDPANGITGDPGTGAFGTKAGNVTITAGGSVYGHYVLANGVGTITAKNGDVGVAANSPGNPFALSLIDGSWSVNAPNGNIYLTEVRNPNADYNSTAPARHQTAPSGAFTFTYGADDSVDLSANGVYLTDSLIPRLSANDDFPVVYPSILDISAGAGGVNLEGNVSLFPSANQNLDVVTTDNGNFTANYTPTIGEPYLLMSDSSQTGFLTAAPGGSILDNFTSSDIGTVLPTELEPAIINISGDMISIPGFQLITSKETEISVGGDLINFGFSGLNQSAADITSITVVGQIYNASSYSFANNVTISSIPANDIPVGVGNAWDAIFALAINPSALAGLTIPANLSPSGYVDYILTHQGVSLFGATLNAQGQLSSGDQGFSYNPATGQLSFNGQMSPALAQELTSGTFTVLHLVNGLPVMNPQTGEYETDTVSWAPVSAVTTLFTESQSASSAELPGYLLGGPGQFNITAGSMSLGNSAGIITYGASNPENGGGSANLASFASSGAAINVTVNGPDTAQGASLNMLQSAIAALGGGDVTVVSGQGSMDLGLQYLPTQEGTTGVGIYTTGGGSVSVTAQGDINIDGSRIATYNGGDITVESTMGNVSVGSGGNSENNVRVTYVNPVTGKASYYSETPSGSGIIANTLIPPIPGATLLWPLNHATVPGSISVTTPQGSITGGAAGIIQEALDGTFAPGPSVTLSAGTANPADDWTSKLPPLFLGNIDFGNSPIIGGTVNLFATGDINVGDVISRQNATVNAGKNVNADVLSGGEAIVSGATISGTIVGVGGVNISGDLGAGLSLLGQNVVANGGASQSTLGSSATATASTQAAAQQASSQSQQQAVADQTQGTDNSKNKKEKTIHVSRVTVLLSSAVAK